METAFTLSTLAEIRLDLCCGDPSGSGASGLPVYSTEGGVKDVSLTLLGTYSLSGDLRKGMMVTAVARYSRLLGDFRQSPIVEIAGDADQWMGGLGLAYTF
mgnify:CR=1 FL=1